MNNMKLDYLESIFSSAAIRVLEKKSEFMVYTALVDLIMVLEVAKPNLLMEFYEFANRYEAGEFNCNSGMYCAMDYLSEIKQNLFKHNKNQISFKPCLDSLNNYNLSQN